jgi:transposase
MMGRQTTDQRALFYEFDLDERVPADHLLRRIDIFTTAALSDLHKELSAFYSHTGRPSIDPQLLIRMLIIGYCYGIRSERRLCEEVALNLAYRWFCRLDLDDDVPDHSTFSKNRHGRFRESDLLRHVFERVVGLCIAEGLVKGETFAVDASFIQANASRYHKEAPETIDWSQIEKPTRAVREYLDALDEAGGLAPGRAQPKMISPTDPASAWTSKAHKRAQFGYGLNYLIDTEHAVIVDVEATPARIYDEVAATKTMIERIEASFGLKPDQLAADTAYGTGKFLGWLVDEQEIDPHIPVWDRSQREDGTFSRGDFAYDAEKDLYTCPNGKALRTTGTLQSDNTFRYVSRKADCDICPLKSKCCPKQPQRRVLRDPNEAARDYARSLAGTLEFKQSAMKGRKSRCALGISKPTTASISCDCADYRAPVMSSTLPRLPKI